METITIPKKEYFELINLYQKIAEKIKKIEQYKDAKQTVKKLIASKYCGLISISDDALLIQKQMRDEWE